MHVDGVTRRLACAQAPAASSVRRSASEKSTRLGELPSRPSDPDHTSGDLGDQCGCVDSTTNRKWLRTVMDLRRQLSNLPKRVEILFSLRLDEATRPTGRSRKPAKPEPRRRLGDVRDAMIAVLAESGGEMRVGLIYEQVVLRLGEPTPSYQNVRDFLNHRSRGDRQLFVRLGYGVYRLPVAGELKCSSSRARRAGASA